MRTVPSHFLPLVVPGLERERVEALARCGVIVGERVELDLDLVRSVDSDIAQALEDYHGQVRSFWDRYVATGSAGDCVVTRRPLQVFTKVDNKSGKVYLKEQVVELSALAGVGVLVDEALGADVDVEGLCGRAEAQGVSVREEGTALHLSLRVPGRHAWSSALGGMVARGEVARVFEVKVSRAKSHDRRNQRLLEVRVLVEEVWPA